MNRSNRSSVKNPIMRLVYLLFAVILILALATPAKAADSDSLIYGGNINNFMKDMPFTTVRIDKNKVNPGGSNVDTSRLATAYYEIVGNSLKYKRNIPGSSDNTFKTSNKVNVPGWDLTFKDAVIFADGRTGDLRISADGDGSGEDMHIVNYDQGATNGVTVFSYSNAISNGELVGPAFDGGSNANGRKLAVKQRVRFRVSEATDSDSLLYSMKDIDVPGPYYTSSTPRGTSYQSTYAENVILISGFISPAYMVDKKNCLLQYSYYSQYGVAGTACGYKFFGTKTDSSSDGGVWGTYNSGFAVIANPQHFAYAWRGSGCGTAMFNDPLILNLRAQYKNNFDDADYTYGTAKGGIAATDTATTGADSFNYDEANDNGTWREWATRFAGIGKTVPITVDPAPDGFTRTVTVDGNDYPVGDNNQFNVTMDRDHDIVVSYTPGPPPDYTEANLYFENTPIPPTITVKKEITNYNDYGSVLDEHIFPITLSGSAEASFSLVNGETSDVYGATIGTSGTATVNISETVPEWYDTNYTVRTVITHANGTTENRTGRSVTLSGGDTAVATVYNTYNKPKAAALTVKKEITNISQYADDTRLTNQEFIINLSGDISASMALKHNETESVVVEIPDTGATVNVSEIVPYSYSLNEISASITHAGETTPTTVTGESITIAPGDTVVITVKTPTRRTLSLKRGRAWKMCSAAHRETEAAVTAVFKSRRNNI